MFGTCLLSDQHIPKVGYQEIDCTFSSYSLTSKGYRFLNLETLSPHTIIEIKFVILL